MGCRGEDERGKIIIFEKVSAARPLENNGRKKRPYGKTYVFLTSEERQMRPCLEILLLCSRYTQVFG